jgi:hypothetical protein
LDFGGENSILEVLKQVLPRWRLLNIGSTCWHLPVLSVAHVVCMVLFSLFEVANTCGGAVEEINYSLWILASEVKKARNRKQKIVFFLAIASHVFHLGYSLSAANNCSVCYWDRERRASC